MKIGKALLGGIVAVLASSSMAIATQCASACIVMCEGHVGAQWYTCYNQCYGFCTTNQLPPGGN
ncbi:hypothetical protein [Hyphobacterium sp.]|uniref:hypothetical protein n=1 Tax=Hyphobacterium sp. TaxID=2004662 RepID=UPI003748542B